MWISAPNNLSDVERLNKMAAEFNLKPQKLTKGRQGPIMQYENIRESTLESTVNCFLVLI